MLLEMLRPALRLLMWSRRRLAGALIVFLLLTGIAFRVASAARPVPGLRPPAGRPAAAARPAATPGPQAPAAAAPASPPPPAGQPPPAAPPAALLAGENFAAAWVSRGAGWLARMRPWATPALMAQLAPDVPAGNPATRVTGPATVTQAAAARADLSVPSDAGPVLVTVVLSGGRWAASSVILAAAGS